jgi:archaellin
MVKRRSSIMIIAGIVVAAIIAGVAVATHLRLSATEGKEHGNETPQEIAQEVLTGKPAHPVQNQTANSTTTNSGAAVDPESLETPEQRAAEGM